MLRPGALPGYMAPSTVTLLTYPCAWARTARQLTSRRVENVSAIVAIRGAIARRMDDGSHSETWRKTHCLAETLKPMASRLGLGLSRMRLAAGTVLVDPD